MMEVVYLPLLGFTMFKPKLLTGEKHQTIRKVRKRPIVVGDILHIYWHLRQKDCEKLLEDYCKETFFITIIYHRHFPNKWDGPALRVDVHTGPQSYAPGYTMSDSQVEDLARSDGFESQWEMAEAFLRMHAGCVDGKTVFQVIRW